MLQVTHKGEVLAVETGRDGRPSFALFCPACGEVWGRVQRDGEGWYCLTRRCKDHPDIYNAGGSFFQRYEWVHNITALLDRHPLLARHEFEVYLAWAERFLLPPLSHQEKYR